MIIVIFTNILLLYTVYYLLIFTYIYYKMRVSIYLMKTALCKCFYIYCNLHGKYNERMKEEKRAKNNRVLLCAQFAQNSGFAV